MLKEFGKNGNSRPSMGSFEMKMANLSVDDLVDYIFFILVENITNHELIWENITNHEHIWLKREIKSGLLSTFFHN
jgi:hypothetical protein